MNCWEYQHSKRTAQVAFFNSRIMLHLITRLIGYCTSEAWSPSPRSCCTLFQPLLCVQYDLSCLNLFHFITIYLHLLVSKGSPLHLFLAPTQCYSLHVRHLCIPTLTKVCTKFYISYEPSRLYVGEEKTRYYELIENKHNLGSI